MVPTRELIEVFRKIVLEAAPELRLQLFAVRGRVLAVRESGRMGPGQPGYTCDVRVLAPDGSDDPDLPVLQRVEIAPLWAGPGQGVFALPPVGALVRVGFYYGDPGRPYIDAVLGEGWEAPAGLAGKLVVVAPGLRLELDSASGDVRVEASRGRIVLAGDVVVTGKLTTGE